MSLDDEPIANLSHGLNLLTADAIYLWFVGILSLAFSSFLNGLRKTIPVPHL